MIDVTKLDDAVLVRIKSARSKSVDEIWGDIEKSWKSSLKIWKNFPEWVNSVPEKKSKVRNNRIFMAMESVINNLTARPSKPDSIPGNGSEEAKQLANDLQKYLLEKYRTLDAKEKMRIAIRHLFFAKIAVMKVFWNRETDDFDHKPVKPVNVRFGRYATRETETEFVVENIDDKTVLQVIDDFPEKEADILKEAGLTKDKAMEENPIAKYCEMWLGNGVVWIMGSKVLEKRRNPYWDWVGLKMTPAEMAKLSKLNGKRRRDLMAKLKSLQPARTKTEKVRNTETGKEEDQPVEVMGKNGRPQTFETYLYNHFDKPRKPYIFRAVLRVEDKPTGETSLIDQVAPLQEGIDSNKRQIADNAPTLNGITKVDTKLTQLSLADARKAHYDPGGILFGPGVKDGVTRETGVAIPEIVYKDMEHSIRELDNIFGTQPTFRGEGNKQETATGRAILREQSVSRLDEMISFVDFVSSELYNWQVQMIKVKYTETHLVKALGAEEARAVIEIMQDDLDDGLEVKVIPGQILPEDEIFRAERASEDYQKGLLDPLTYFETVGGYDNPKETAKRVIMYKLNPLSLIELSPEDIQHMQRAEQVKALILGGGQAPGGQGGQEGDPAQERAIRARLEQLATSKEFQSLPREEQLAKISQIRASLTNQKVGGVKSTVE